MHGNPCKSCTFGRYSLTVETTSSIFDRGWDGRGRKVKRRWYRQRKSRRTKKDSLEQAICSSESYFCFQPCLSKKATERLGGVLSGEFEKYYEVLASHLSGQILYGLSPNPYNKQKEQTCKKKILYVCSFLFVLV